MTQRKQETNTLPFRGGVIKNQEPSLLPPGGFSDIQNMRARHPGFVKRLGARALHTVADSANEVMSLFQFSRGRVTERHTYAQMGDGDVLEATTAPPGITTGAFGSEVFSSAMTTAETELLTGWTNDGFETFTASGVTISSAINSSGTGSAYSNAITAVIGAVYKVTFTETLNSGTAPSLAFTSVSDGTGTVSYNAATANGANTAYVTAKSATMYALFGVNSGVATNFSIASMTIKQVTAHVPASWSILDDRMVYSNGVDQHQIYPGSDQYVKKAIYVDASTSVPTVVDLGTDYTEQATDGLSTTVIPLDSMVALGPADNKFSDNADTLATSTTNVMTNACESAAEWNGAAYGITVTLGEGTGGQSGECVKFRNAGAAAGEMFLSVPVTTIVGRPYVLSFYFLKGSSASGRVGVGSANDNSWNLGELTGLADVAWTLYQIYFTATSTTTYIYAGNTSAVSGEYSYIDTISVDSYEGTGNWTASSAAMIPGTGGSTTNKYALTNSAASAGSVYHDVTTVVGKTYQISYYFKKGSGVSGKLQCGTTSVANSLYDSGAMTDADWAAKTGEFVATETTTRITLLNVSTTAGQTSLYDTIKLDRVVYTYLYLRTDIPATGFKFTVSAANGSDAVAQVKYWNGAWTDASITDGTIAVAGKTLGQTGSMTWTLKTDEYPYYMFDESGFWYQFSLSSGSLDSEVEISAIQYNTTWQGIQNVWDGIPIVPTEVSFYDQSATTYLTYSADSVSVGAMTASDKVYVNSPDPLVGIYVDMGGTPNTTASTVVNYVYYWNGTAWASVGTIYDGTDGLSKSGWIIFGRQSAVQPLQFNDSQSFSYWYYFTVDKTLSATLTASITLMPYYSISLFGNEGLCNAAWQDRMLYVFNRYPTDVVVSSKRNPMVLNGDDYTFLERPADGRANRIVCMRRIYNDLLVWQEEKGVIGGSLTKYTYPSTLANIAKTVISTHYGTFSAKSAVVVEGIRMNVQQDSDAPISVGFFLSHYGVFMTDGTTVYCISDQAHSSIQNYFDPEKTECIRAGYESKMWLSYDPSHHCLRLGLVSGSSATLPNIFPVFDIQDRAWSFDSLAQEFACLTTIEAGSGNVTAIQIAGGIDDGLVYQSNYGANDVSTAIDAYATEEIDDEGHFFKVDEVQLRMKVQSAGNCTVTPTLNGIAGTAKTLAMTADLTNRAMRRHVATMDWVSDHISIKYQNATTDQSIYLFDRGISLKRLEGQ